MTAAMPSPPDAIAEPRSSGLVANARRSLGQWLISLGTSLSGGTDTTSHKPQQSETDRFSSLASMIPGVVYQRIVKPDGDIRYTYISEGARDLFGVAPEDVMRDPEALFSTYSDEYKANFRQRLVAASKSLTTWDVEASFTGPGGHTRFTHAIAKPERLRDGSVLWTGLILDATRIKEAEERLRSATRSIEAANNAKSMFLANMSHEIRTPMNGVLGMADLMLKTELDGRQHRLLSTLKHSAQTLLAIINDVLDISRIEAGRFELENEPFDLYRCLEDAIDLCASAAYKKGLETSLIAEGALPVIVKGDGGRLRQVLINLIGNAVKFTTEGEVTLRATSSPVRNGRATVIIKVIDTGIGIDAKAKAKLFAPFSQADSSISRRFGGTGLGLAITRHLVTLMGGTVELDSEVGHGTTITVRLPLEVVSHRPAAALVEPLSDRRVLIVDDRERVRETIASKLNGSGALLAFADGEQSAIEALEKARTQGRPFYAAIIDRVRPASDSLRLGKTLRADPRFDETTIVNVVSMNSKMSGDAPDVISLPKPIRQHDILSVLRHRRPLIAAREGDEVKTHSAPGKTNLGLNVLLAEDNPVNQEVANEYLSSFGCTVTIAQDGQEAVEFLRGGHYDIVLMDCQMPVMDGLTAVRTYREIEARECRPRTPIIACTANAYESDRMDAVAAGMDDYLVKPFDDAALLAMLEKWREAAWRQT